MDDVVVVGAGLSGLAVATAAPGSVSVLEARARAGGRVLGVDGVDLGPSWIWPGQSRVDRLARDLGVALFPQPGRGALVWDDGHAVRRGRFDMHGGARRLVGGPSALIEGLVDQLPADALRFHHSVEALRDGGDHVGIEVRTSEGALQRTARQVVLALPPRIMAKLSFTPALPDDAQSALSSISTWMAGEAKFLALYDRPFWREAGLSGDAVSSGMLGQVWDASGLEGPFSLGGFVRPDGPERAVLDRAQLTSRALEQLVRLFGPEAGTPLAVHLQDWFTESATATPADAVRPRGHPTYGPPFDPVCWEGRLILSGTEFAPELGGYLEGALAAAEAALRALSPRGA